MSGLPVSRDASCDHDRYLLARNSAVRLNRRKLFARIAQLEGHASQATPLPPFGPHKQSEPPPVESTALRGQTKFGLGSNPPCAADAPATCVKAPKITNSPSGSEPDSHASDQSLQNFEDGNKRIPQAVSLEHRDETKATRSFAKSKPASARRAKDESQGHISSEIVTHMAADNTARLPTEGSFDAKKAPHTGRRHTVSNLSPSTLPMMTIRKIVPSTHRESTRKSSSAPLSAQVLEKMQKTREAFVNRARYYLGVPYRPGAKPREGQEIGPGAQNSRLFLDCCGLVRQCVRDLKSDFGFEIGPWNQSYQMDTLPIILNAEELKPGDLIFVKGIYHDKSKRRPRNDIVHVEIFIGGRTGKATIGARGRDRAVDVFDSYHLESPIYTVHSLHFRSLDTWLRGMCRPVTTPRKHLTTMCHVERPAQVAPGPSRVGL
mmetsp:Transcript_12728/g.25300  ORF Transcript_12728/g.25300 Transcript_12728/m.25300 type:complete len:434 (-) Transcript_12728:140-1441(-)